MIDLRKTLTTKIDSDVKATKELASSNLTKKIKILQEELHERTKGPSEEEIR